MQRLVLSILVVGSAYFTASAEDKPARKANPFAPSLIQLTDDEENEIDRIIDRFILFDTGRLKGTAGRQAFLQFQKLGPNSIPGLIRGLNRAAKIEASCPALTIGKKLATMLRASRDPELLEFARENIGAGITRSYHMAVLRDLRVLCMMRKRVVGAASVKAKAKAWEKSLSSLSVTELGMNAKTEKGSRLRSLLSELATRKGEEVIGALASVAATRDKKVGPLGQFYLAKHLSKLSDPDIRSKLQDSRPEVRVAATRVVAGKKLDYAEELIELLKDSSAEVRKNARQSLIKLSKGKDFGPRDDSSQTQRDASIKKWRQWLKDRN